MPAFSKTPSGASAGSAPAFENAVTLKQKACAAGPNPDYWYPVEWESSLAREKVIGAKLWDTAVAVYRARDGEIHAVEDRCAHRHVKLSYGFVSGCSLHCIYHGWTYTPDGKLAEIPHELFGKNRPSVQLRTFPVQVRYGLIWIFFGDASLSSQRPLPEIPEVDGDRPWVCVPIDFRWRAHPTMIINNVMDSTHVATLHNRDFRTRSFNFRQLTECRAAGDRVIVRHDVEADPKGLLWYLANDIKVKTHEACYEYPYLWVSIGGVYKLWNFVLPMDRYNTRVFMLNLSEQVKVPFTPFTAPRWLHRMFLPVTKRFVVTPLFAADGWSAVIEQEGFDEHFEEPGVELHPAPRLCYQLTVRKWEEHLARTRNELPAGKFAD